MRVLGFALALGVLAACQPGGAPQSETDETQALTVFTGGTIYTGVADQPTADAVVVGPDGRIVAVVPPASADWSEDEVTIVDLGGAVMFPGFTDAHAHLMGIGQRELTLNLEGTASVGELVTRTEAEIQGKAPGEILFGRGWIETGWPEGRMPSAADLDAVSPDNPVIYTRADGHALVANTSALKAAGIYDLTEDPSGGRVERDDSGKATGIVIDNAMGPVFQLLAAPTEEDVETALEVGANTYASRGWTGVHNMSVSASQAPIMARLDGEGRLPLRVYNAFDVDAFEVAESRKFETDTVTNRAVKLYMDGALGSRGALLIAPYSDQPDTNGLSLLDTESLHDLMMKAKGADVQLAIHAIGDLANRHILETFEALGNGDELRWRIEHAQIFAPQDVARVGELGLIASMQPSHAIGDLKFAPSRLGLDRLAGAYAWQDMLAGGAVVAGGSDAPVEVGSPLIEFYAAVARQDLDGNAGEGWHPEQALSRDQALALFTSAAAFAAFQEDDLGTIEVGKIADFSVFDRDLMTIPAAEILDAQARMTIIGGEIVWQAAE